METKIIELAELAIEYHINNPRKWDGTGLRPTQVTVSLPVQQIIPDQYDCGDCCGRAMDSWLYLRHITGEDMKGHDAEKGVGQFLDRLLDTKLGLACIPELHDPGKGDYYNMWDQGRVLRYLVHAWEKSDTDGRSIIEARINRMIDGLNTIAVKDTFEPWGDCLFFAAGEYYENKAFFRENAQCWIPRAAQVVEPLARYAGYTGRKDILDLAILYANGFLSEYEMGPLSAEKGANPYVLPSEGRLVHEGVFSGHTHGNMAGLIGLAVLANVIPDRNLACKYLDAAVRSWKWILDEKSNPNPGAMFGWLPEFISKKHCWSLSEFCCTADWVQFNAELGLCALKYEAYGFLTVSWDYLEATLNNMVDWCMFRASDSELAILEDLFNRTWEYLKPGEDEKAGLTPDAAGRRLFWSRLRGGVAGNMSPIDKVYRCSSGYLRSHLSVLDKDFKCSGDHIMLFPGGCCCFSTGRVLGTLWNHLIIKDGGRIYVTFMHDKKTEDMDVTINGNEMVLDMKTAMPVSVHLPQWIDKATVSVFINSVEAPCILSPDQNWLLLDNTYAGERINLKYTLKEYTTVHHIGIIPGKDIDRHGAWQDRGEYTLSWKGGRILSVDPKALWFPLISN